jgi:uncharacterized protein
MEEKFSRLKEILNGMGRVLIAYSGGVDSTFLLKVSHDLLNDNVLAVTAYSNTYPKRELNEACEMAKKIGVKHVIIESKELDIKEFKNNPPDRCYYCKKELFLKLSKIAKEYDFNYILDGSNYDDKDDYRPGRSASKEFNIISPLEEVELTKDEIRTLSRKLKLPTWDKQPFACLSSRFPYGEEITENKLKKVEMAEEYLNSVGFKIYRVRNHGDIVRIEVSKSDIGLILELSDKIIKKFKDIGYKYITLDLEGYRTGSMNEILNREVL